MTNDMIKNLSKAVIYPLGNKAKGVECMFNPSEYTISKSNSYTPQKNTKGKNPVGDFLSVGSMELRLSLIFDTYKTGKDVTTTTNRLWEFMDPQEETRNKKSAKSEPIKVVFEWGGFKFVAVIKSITQQFTLFSREGTPVRAKVDVNFTQYEDPNDKRTKMTNPTSGGGPTDRIWKFVAGDRLDTIAEKVYSDTSKWRIIAEHNQLTNPLAVQPGTLLRIPED